jgi:hypothetical protein
MYPILHMNVARREGGMDGWMEGREGGREGGRDPGEILSFFQPPSYVLPSAHTYIYMYMYIYIYR